MHPDLGKFCDLVIPCALTALDHWSPEVKVCGLINMLYDLTVVIICKLLNDNFFFF